MANPAKPVTRINAIDTPPGHPTGEVEIRKPLAFLNSTHAEAFRDGIGCARIVDVLDSTARLALTAEQLHLRDIVREVGRVEIATITCPASTYTAGVAGIVYFDAVACVISDTGATATPDETMYFSNDAQSGDASALGLGLSDGSYTAAQMATAWAAYIDGAYAWLNAAAVGARVTITFTDLAGNASISTANENITSYAVTESGAASTHSADTTLTFASQSRTVGVSGQIVLPASNQTAAQVAALVQAGFHALTNITATVSGAVVTLTADTAAVHADVADSSGLYTLATTQQGIAIGGTFDVTSPAAAGSESAFTKLVLVKMFAVHKNGVSQAFSSGVFTKITWPGTRLNADGLISNSTFTAPFAGILDMTAAIEVPITSGTQVLLRVYVNGVGREIPYHVDQSATRGDGRATAPCSIFLSAGDTVDIYFYTTRTGTTTSPGYDTTCYWSGQFFKS